jgi:hypothetical protein
VDFESATTVRAAVKNVVLELASQDVKGSDGHLHRYKFTVGQVSHNTTIGVSISFEIE